MSMFKKSKKSTSRWRDFRPAVLLLSLIIGGNAVVWALAILVLHQYALVLGTASLSYTLGLAHALDADHISAIDNVTRRLIQDGQRPTAVGFFFSLGHSTIVVLLTLAITLLATGAESRFPQLEHMGGMIGTSISAAFLLLVAGINLLLFRTTFRTFLLVKRGEPYVELNLDQVLQQLGWIGRACRPIVQLIDQSWKMYFVGFLFGLGFDTATQVGLLGISAAASARHLPLWSILIFPLLFTAGMCLVDTIDGILMLGAYGWAYVHPVRKLYYNMTITAISVLVAMLVGGIELVNLLGLQLGLRGPIWDRIQAMGDHFGAIGVFIVCLFVVAWIGSAAIYRWLGYHELEFSTTPAE